MNTKNAGISSYTISKELDVDAQLKDKVASILDIEVSPHWNVTQTIPKLNLALVHYSENADMAKFGHLRGIVVDTKANCVVCPSYGYAPTVKLNSLTPRADGSLVLHDTDGNHHSLSLEQIDIKQGFESVTIRAWLYRGHFFLSTYKCLDIQTTPSRWGSNKTFYEMYQELNGPSRAELFGESTQSNVVHFFLIVHPGLLVATKQHVGPGYIVYLDNQQAYPVEREICPYQQPDGVFSETVEPLEHPTNGIVSSNKEEIVPKVQTYSNTQDTRPKSDWIDNEIHRPLTASYFPDKLERPLFIDPPSLGLEEANHHLVYGYHNNPQPVLGTGEFILIYVREYEQNGEILEKGGFDNVGRVTRMIRVQSTAYSFRSEMRNDDPNLRHRLFDILTDANLVERNERDTPQLAAEKQQKFATKYPAMEMFTVESLAKSLETEPLYEWPGEVYPGLVPTNKSVALHTIFQVFLLCTPPNQQREVVRLYGQIFEERRELFTWLWNLVQTGYDIKSLENARLAKIVSDAREYAQSREKEGTNRSKDGRVLSVEVMTKNSIQNFLNKEYGNSLYRMVRTMRQAQRKVNVDSK